MAQVLGIYHPLTGSPENYKPTSWEDLGQQGHVPNGWKMFPPRGRGRRLPAVQRLDGPWQDGPRTLGQLEEPTLWLLTHPWHTCLNYLKIEPSTATRV